jgi:hypothetical protein
MPPKVPFAAAKPVVGSPPGQTCVLEMQTREGMPLGYRSSHTSSMRQPLKRLFTISVGPFT